MKSCFKQDTCAVSPKLGNHIGHWWGSRKPVWLEESEQLGQEWLWVIGRSLVQSTFCCFVLLPGAKLRADVTFARHVLYHRTVSPAQDHILDSVARLRKTAHYWNNWKLYIERWYFHLKKGGETDDSGLYVV